MTEWLNWLNWDGCLDLSKLFLWEVKSDLLTLKVSWSLHQKDFLANVVHPVTQSCLTLCNPLVARLLCPWNFPSKNTGMGCHFFLRGSSPPRDWTWVSWVFWQELAGRFFTIAPPGKPQVSVELCFTLHLTGILRTGDRCLRGQSKLGQWRGITYFLSSTHLSRPFKQHPQAA